jgi:hypothetical protein
LQAFLALPILVLFVMHVAIFDASKVIVCIQQGRLREWGAVRAQATSAKIGDFSGNYTFYRRLLHVVVKITDRDSS